MQKNGAENLEQEKLISSNEISRFRARNSSEYDSESVRC